MHYEIAEHRFEVDDRREEIGDHREEIVDCREGIWNCGEEIGGCGEDIGDLVRNLVIIIGLIIKSLMITNLRTVVLRKFLRVLE